MEKIESKFVSINEWLQIIEQKKVLYKDMVKIQICFAPIFYIKSAKSQSFIINKNDIEIFTKKIIGKKVQIGNYLETITIDEIFTDYSVININTTLHGINGDNFDILGYISNNYEDCNDIESFLIRK